jgi:transposase
MNVLDFEKLVKSEKTAMHYVLTRCSMADAFHCPACSSDRLYEIEGGKRRRCARCGHSFNPFAGRYLNSVKLSAQEWLWLIKLFELEMSATVIAAETGISYPTILKAIDTIRCAIADTHCESYDIPEDCEAAQQLASFAAAKGGGDAGDTESAADDTTFLHLRFGADCVILTKKSPGNGHIRCRSRALEIVDHGRNYPRFKVYCSAKGFWPFAKERLVKYHGVPAGRLPSYLQEMTFRWMNRGTPLFDLILERLCRYVPECSTRDATDESARARKQRIYSLHKQ